MGAAGQTVVLAGRGFAPDTDVVLRWNVGSRTIAAHTDAAGTFRTVVLILPNEPLGPRTLSVDGDPAVRDSYLVVASPLHPGGASRSIRFGR